MTIIKTKITPCLWYDGQALPAAEHYVSLFPNSRIKAVSHYPEGTPGETGSVMTVDFELDGQPFVGLNGGPEFHFSEAVSFQLDCADQAEVDHYWDGLIADGGEEGPCGWLKDRFGLSWQVVPARLPQLLQDSDPARAQRAMQAMMSMKKIDVAAIEAARRG